MPVKIREHNKRKLRKVRAEGIEAALRLARRAGAVVVLDDDVFLPIKSPGYGPRIGKARISAAIDALTAAGGVVKFSSKHHFRLTQGKWESIGWVGSRRKAYRSLTIASSGGGGPKPVEDDDHDPEDPGPRIAR